MAESNGEPRGNRASQYREKAVAARALAAKVKNGDIREQLNGIAAAYELLAEYMENLPEPSPF
jgi:hypothetical protein